MSGISLFVGIVVAALLIYLGFRKVKRRRTSVVLPGTNSGIDADELRIENVTPGGVFQIQAGGDNGSDLDIVVSKRHLYAQKGFEWIELEGQTGDAEPIYITVVDDDELEISVSKGKYRLSDIDLKETDLDSGWPEKVKFSGRSYKIDETGDATYYQNSNTKEEGQYFAFAEYKIMRRSADHSTHLAIERWDSGDIQVHLSQPIPAHRITVFSNREQE
jgi:hypothetical protein